VACWQSPSALQFFPSPQRGQALLVPPQSTSDSLPFLSPSAHSGVVAQTPPLQMLLAQSLARLHGLPAPQPGHTPPPQSTSTSAPSRRPSSQEGLLQRWLAEQIKPLTQSASTPQAAPALQRVAQSPPQSRSVSLPFWTPSLQLGVPLGQFGPGHSGSSHPRRPSRSSQL
jgi:hypothetical protein